METSAAAAVRVWWLEGRRARGWRGALSVCWGRRCGGGGYVGRVVGDLGVGEEGEKSRGRVCGIDQCRIWLLQAKNEEKV